MKKNLFRISIIAGILLLVFIFGRGVYFYGMYSIPNEKYFGNQYKETLHIMSFQDKKHANVIMRKVDSAFSFIGESDVADSTYGELNRYCVTDEDAVRENHSLRLITAEFDKETGYIWFVYDQKAFDSNNQIMSGASDILVRATVIKADDEWQVIDTREHP